MKAAFGLVECDGSDLRFEVGFADVIRPPSDIEMAFHAPS
jgi:hypothetical protein